MDEDKFNELLRTILLKHWGHHVEIDIYGEPVAPSNVCLECVDCNKIILNTDLHTICRRRDRRTK